MGRARTTKALRRQRKVAESLDTSWKKYARCKICRRAFVANNYSDRKVRLSHLKIGGKLTCPWCFHRDGKFVVQLMLIAEKVANVEMSFCHTAAEERPRPDCKCLACVAGRILKTHEELPTIR